MVGFSRLHGSNASGAFQTGKGDVVTLWLAHECVATGVNNTRVELAADGLLTSATLSADNSISIRDAGGTLNAYTTNDAYDQALVGQKNVDAILGAFSVRGNPVDVQIQPGVATSASLTNDTADTPLVAGADVFGTELVESSGIVWKMVLTFERKGMFGSPEGESSIGDTSVATVHALLDEVLVFTGGAIADDGDLETMTDVDTSASFGSLFTVNGVDTAWAAAIGSGVTIISNANGSQATSQSVLVNVWVAPDSRGVVV